MLHLVNANSEYKNRFWNVDQYHLFAGPWNTVFSMKEEHKLARGHLLATIPQMEKEWRVSFEFMANSFRGLGKSSKKIEI